MNEWCSSNSDFLCFVLFLSYAVCKYLRTFHISHAESFLIIDVFTSMDVLWYGILCSSLCFCHISLYCFTLSLCIFQPLVTPHGPLFPQWKCISASSFFMLTGICSFPFMFVSLYAYFYQFLWSLLKWKMFMHCFGWSRDWKIVPMGVQAIIPLIH
jgi:hypothetical protein